VLHRGTHRGRPQRSSPPTRERADHGAQAVPPPAVARPRRPRTDGAGVPQPPHQRQPRHAHRRNPHGTHLVLIRRPGATGGGRGGCRHRHRYRAGQPPQHLQALLHHEGPPGRHGYPRHRPGPLGLQGHRRIPRWRHRGAQCDGRGHRLRHLTPGRWSSRAARSPPRYRQGRRRRSPDPTGGRGPCGRGRK